MKIFDRGLKTVLKIGRWNKTGRSQFIHRGQGMFYVTGSFSGVNDFRTRTGQPADGRRQFLDGDALAIGNVKHAGRWRRSGEEDIRGHNIFHENKISRLLAVAVNQDRLISQRALNEDGYGSGVLALGILTRTEDVEIAQARGLQPAFVCEHFAIKLAVELGDSVGTFRFWQHRLDFWHDWIVPVNRGGRA